MTKRIFIALLIVSIMVSAFAITASANEEPVIVDNMPIIVFDMNKIGNLYDLMQGGNVGTVVSNK